MHSPPGCADMIRVPLEQKNRQAKACLLFWCTRRGNPNRISPFPVLPAWQRSPSGVLCLRFCRRAFLPGAKCHGPKKPDTLRLFRTACDPNARRALPLALPRGSASLPRRPFPVLRLWRRLIRCAQTRKRTPVPSRALPMQTCSPVRLWIAPARSQRRKKTRP